mgnify:CR=1 FL=1
MHLKLYTERKERYLVAGQGVDPLLNAGSAGVIDADDRDTRLDGVIHQVAHLLGVDTAKGSAADCEVVGEGRHGTAVDVSGSGNNTVSGHFPFFHSEVLAGMLGMHPELLEGVFIK